MEEKFKLSRSCKILIGMGIMFILIFIIGKLSINWSIAVYGKWDFFRSIRSQFMREVIIPIVVSTITFGGVALSLFLTITNNRVLQREQYMEEYKLKLKIIENELFLKTLEDMKKALDKIEDTLKYVQITLPEIFEKYKEGIIKVEKIGSTQNKFAGMKYESMTFGSLIASKGEIIVESGLLDANLALLKYSVEGTKLLYYITKNPYTIEIEKDYNKVLKDNIYFLVELRSMISKIERKYHESLSTQL